MWWPFGNRDERRKTLERQLQEAEGARLAAEKLVQESRQVTEKLNAHVEKNHFGDMLHEAMARRYVR